ncbi:hypothetical protein MML48_2g00014118 [Holotrichia oblita]|uniref:Uncharacterized protein n=1 Tax=Holotrichia oblita TaxID=644536 RepID=A0ACB9TJB6_HOLOL|nr:hypothetical protein MML48_2g00014118 [Holotrichia oblita]
MSEWIGYMVSIECDSNKGAYQGEIISVNNTEIILSKAFYNGIPCEESEVSIRASDIIDLKLIDKQTSAAGTSIITIAKPVAKRAGRTQSVSESGNANKANLQNGMSNSNVKSKPIDIIKPNHDSYKMSTPNKKDKNKGKWNRGWRDEACFGSPLDDAIFKDFDFEKMLALFDKQAIWEEINSQKPDVVKHTDQNKRTAKYRHDENILATTPTTYRQIIVPKQEICEYVTDDGLIIPSISRLLRNKLFLLADRAGLTWKKRNELMGRAATEMALQLLGGGHRLNPHNTHQMPTVVVLCGPNRQGAIGINAARQLASHGVNTIVYIISTESDDIITELALYKMTTNKIITSITELPELTDLIIVALCEESDNLKLYSSLADWTKKNRASVLAIDPPAAGTPGITAKFSLVPVLPLPHSVENGKIYLCNLGFPIELFRNLKIQYKSPFGSKFVIPLHPNEDI